MFTQGSNATNNRIRIMQPGFYQGWQEQSAANDAADEIIDAPEKYLLSQEKLFEAEGGYGGLSVQMLSILFGVGSVFAMSPRMSMYWKTGSMNWMEWLCISGAGTLGYLGGRYVSVNAMGNQAAYKNHWRAYSFVKACNRWEGRQILSKPPMMY